MGTSPELLERIRGEFLEMPGLKITTAQACCLWNLSEQTLSGVLDTLIAEGFLLRTPSGEFIALPSAAKMPKANLSEERRPWRCPHCQHQNWLSPDDSSRTRGVAAPLRCAACARFVNVTSAFA